jgi:hypothetical protein
MLAMEYPSLAYQSCVSPLLVIEASRADNSSFASRGFHPKSSPRGDTSGNAVLVIVFLSREITSTSIPSASPAVGDTYSVSATCAAFVIRPTDRGAESRCYIRDPDGYLTEVGQSIGLLHGKFVRQSARKISRANL